VRREVLQAGRRRYRLRFGIDEHGTVTDAEGRWAVYVPLRKRGKIVVLQTAR